MMKKIRGIRIKEIFCYLLFVAVLGLSPCAYALDAVVGSASAGWQTWAASNETGTPFWAHTSSDGYQENVGFYLSNTGAFSGSTAGPGAIPFWGIGNAADSSFYLTSSGSSQAALKIEIAGNANVNAFGWYEKSTGIQHAIFSGSAGAGATATFSPTASYGFYFSTVDGTFKTESAGDQHFAIFEASDGYWLGMEDLAFSNSDKDYNDMIVKVSPVPEPMTLLLLGAGLIGLAGLRRKK